MTQDVSEAQLRIERLREGMAAGLRSMLGDDVDLRELLEDAVASGLVDRETAERALAFLEP